MPHNLLWVTVLLFVSQHQVASFTAQKRYDRVVPAPRGVENRAVGRISLFGKTNIDDDESSEQQKPIDKFRTLMGNLYGVAGLAHAADCYAGPSKLLVAAGSAPYPDLPLEGQALVALWCAAGPISFITSRVKEDGGLLADLGLIFYGAVEVFGAAVLSNSLRESVGSMTVEVDALMNAVLVQVIVFVSWLYSRMKNED